MSVYRVEKSELDVVIFQADGSIMKGVVFLDASAYSHARQQTLPDLMKEAGNFFAFRSAGGEFCVANKRTVTHIRFDLAVETTRYESLGTRQDVDIRFAGGEQLSGTVTIEMPEGRSRLFDFINAMKGFFPLSNQDANYLVNVDQVRDISPKHV